jgi:hypothetical protein
VTITYTIQENHISHNRFDDEVIIVNLATGSYFSLHGAATEIWTLLQKGPASAESLATAFGGDQNAANEIDVFLQQLRAQDLIAAGHAPAYVGIASSPYATPLLEVFDELRELLLADIIHDTDEAGWPHLATQAKE